MDLLFFPYMIEMMGIINKDGDVSSRLWMGPELNLALKGDSWPADAKEWSPIKRGIPAHRSRYFIVWAPLVDYDLPVQQWVYQGLEGKQANVICNARAGKKLTNRSFHLFSFSPLVIHMA